MRPFLSKGSSTPQNLSVKSFVSTPVPTRAVYSVKKQRSAENSKANIVPTWILHLKETSASSLFGSLRPAELKRQVNFSPLQHVWIWNNNNKNRICPHLWPYGHFVVLPQKADACFQNRCLVHLPIIWTHLHTLVQDQKIYCNANLILFVFDISYIVKILAIKNSKSLLNLPSFLTPPQVWKI